MSAMEITLTLEQNQTLEIQHARTRDGRVRDRIKAVLLASEGWNSAKISQALRIHETTVQRHISDYLSTEKLTPENGGSKSDLSETQTIELIEHVTKKTDHHIYEIVAYTRERFGLDYTLSGMTKWRHKNGFSYKKPKGVPHKFDEEKQHAFIQAYEALKASCTKDETILFMDAVHPTQATKISDGWILTGKDKPIETTGSRTRLNIIGAMDLSDIARTVVMDYETINSENIVRFFCTLRNTYPLTHKLHIILDGAGYHRSDLVKNCASVLNIDLHTLPPYSPNLNPIERLWKVMNEEARNNVYFKNKSHFTEAIRHFFSVRLPEMAETLASRINDNFQILKSAS